MATIAFPTRQAAGLQWRSWPALAVPVLAIAAVAVNPVGFIGVGNDDSQYLQAARCWVASGHPCVPANHWASRWPVVAPLALTTGALGENRSVLALAPLLYWAAAIALIGWLGRHWFNPRVGYVAAALLAVTPVFAAAALQPSADTAELAWQLAALAAATVAFKRQGRGWAVAAGALAGVALAARDTSVLFIGAAAMAWLFLPRERRRVLLWAVAGLGAVVAAEMVVYMLATGDALWRYGLAAGHTTIPTTELPRSFDTSAAPFFNPDYIKSWKREVGIHLFWPLDPWLNLLASPKAMQTLIAPVALAIAYWRLLPRPHRTTVELLAGCALLVALVLVYGLAIDPKPRMFMGLLAAAALVSGALVNAASAQGQRLLPSFVIAACVASGIYFLSIWATTYEGEARARQWIAANPGRIELTENARGYLILVPAARELPRQGSGRPLLISLADRTCAATLEARDRLRLLEARGGPNSAQAELCLWAYR